MKINRNSWHYKMFVIGNIYPLEFQYEHISKKKHEENVDVFSYWLTAICGLVMFPFFIICEGIVDVTKELEEKVEDLEKVKFYGGNKK